MSGNKNKLLIGTLLTSFSYLSYKLYDKLSPKEHHELLGKNENENKNYLILKRMNERLNSGHLQNTPFPTYLEMNSIQAVKPERRTSFCQSIEIQLEKDWNYFLYHLSKILLK